MDPKKSALHVSLSWFTEKGFETKFLPDQLKWYFRSLVVSSLLSLFVDFSVVFIESCCKIYKLTQVCYEFCVSKRDSLVELRNFKIFKEWNHQNIKESSTICQKLIQVLQHDILASKYNQPKKIKNKKIKIIVLIFVIEHTGLRIMF